MADTVDEQQRLLLWILDLFSPVTEPTRRDDKSVRFGPGEFDMPGMFFSHWAVIRGLVWAFQEVAPCAWSELKTHAQDAVDGMLSQWRAPDEPDQLEQIFLAYVDVLGQETGLMGSTPGLRSESREILASVQQREMLRVPNLSALHAWRARWNLDEDRSLFTAALVAAAMNETDLGRQFPAGVSAKVTFAALLKSGLMDVSVIPGFSLQAARLLQQALSPPYPQAFHVKFPRFNPFLDTSTTYKAAAREAFKREIDAHIEACRAALAVQEFATVPVKRVHDIHCRWYIRSQVLSESLTEIAAAECAEPKTVSAALKNIVALAGVPQPEFGRPGRKKKPRLQ